MTDSKEVLKTDENIDEAAKQYANGELRSYYVFIVHRSLSMRRWPPMTFVH